MKVVYAEWMVRVMKVYIDLVILVRVKEQVMKVVKYSSVRWFGHLKMMN